MDTDGDPASGQVCIRYHPNMIDKSPSVWFIGFVAAFCIFLMGLEALVWVDENFLFPVILAALFLLLVIIVRTVLALWPSRRGAEGSTWRDRAPALLASATVLVLLLSVPSQSRMMLSRASLNAYANDVISAGVNSAGTCDNPFHERRERWVGLYRIACADYDGRTVLLLVDEPLIPSGGTTWLMEGKWDLWLQD